MRIEHTLARRGTSGCDEVAQLIAGRDVETTALAGSTEESQFG